MPAHPFGMRHFPHPSSGFSDDWKYYPLPTTVFILSSFSGFNPAFITISPAGIAY
jgi:hypothetical protein